MNKPHDFLIHYSAEYNARYLDKDKSPPSMTRYLMDLVHRFTEEGNSELASRAQSLLDELNK